MDIDVVPTPSANLNRRSLWIKRGIAIALLLALTALLTALCLAFGPQLLAFASDASAVRAWAQDNAPWSYGVFCLANMAQIVFAFLPGEPLELAAGYAFGFWEGTLLCLVGSALGTALILGAVRGFGLRVVNLFFSTDSIASVSWLSQSRRFEMLLFIVFLIPGSPKDLLTYVAGLGRCSALRIVAITTVGRIPSIVTSTITASAFGEGNYVLAFGAIAVTLVLVAGGAIAYRRMAQREQSRKELPAIPHSQNEESSIS